MSSTTVPAGLRAAVFLSALAITAAVPNGSQAEGFAPLFRYVPDGANAALFIDAEQLKTTRLAREQGWFEPKGDAGRPIYIPAEAERIVVASRVDPAGRLAPQWDAALMRLSAPI